VWVLLLISFSNVIFVANYELRIYCVGNLSRGYVVITFLGVVISFAMQGKCNLVKVTWFTHHWLNPLAGIMVFRVLSMYNFSRRIVYSLVAAFLCEIIVILTLIIVGCYSMIGELSVFPSILWKWSKHNFIDPIHIGYSTMLDKILSWIHILFSGLYCSIRDPNIISLPENSCTVLSILQISQSPVRLTEEADQAFIHPPEGQYYISILVSNSTLLPSKELTLKFQCLVTLLDNSYLGLTYFGQFFILRSFAFFLQSN